LTLPSCRDAVETRGDESDSSWLSRVQRVQSIKVSSNYGRGTVGSFRYRHARWTSMINVSLHSVRQLREGYFYIATMHLRRTSYQISVFFFSSSSSSSSREMTPHQFARVIISRIMRVCETSKTRYASSGMNIFISRIINIQRFIIDLESKPVRRHATPSRILSDTVSCKLAINLTPTPGRVERVRNVRL